MDPYFKLLLAVLALAIGLVTWRVSVRAKVQGCGFASAALSLLTGLLFAAGIITVREAKEEADQARGNGL